jgi:MarR family transcriptional regulator, temperature-dependent positive regulator of motility
LHQRYPGDPLELGQRTGHLVWRAHQYAWRVFTEEAASHQITPVQAAILLVIETEPRIDQKSLAAVVALDKATTGNVVARLEGRGLLTRKIDPSDRRARVLQLTDTGKALNRKMEKVALRTRERLVSRLTPMEQAEFVRLLRKFVGLAGN